MGARRRRAGLDESGIVNYIALHGVVSNDPPRERAVTLIVLNEGESLSVLPDWAMALITGEPYAILAPRGIGATAWTPESANYMSRAHLCVGRTIDQGRVCDIAAIARHLNGDGPIKVAGRGRREFSAPTRHCSSHRFGK